MMKLLLIWCVSCCLCVPVWAEDGLQYPLDVAVSAEGVIYVADRKLPGIWEIRDGQASIYFQGSKQFRTPLNAVRCVIVTPQGQVIAGDSATREVYAFNAEKQPVPLTAGHIGIASDLLLTDNTLFVSDLETQRIWKFPVSGGEPQEVAVIAGVRGLARGLDNALICLTTLEDPLRKVSDDGQLQVLLSGRPFQLPHHIAVWNQSLYVADNYANTIWKVNLEGEAKAEPFLTGAPLVKPVGLCVDKETLLIADPHAKQIFRATTAGEVTPVVQK